MPGLRDPFLTLGDLFFELGDLFLGLRDLFFGLGDVPLRLTDLLLTIGDLFFWLGDLEFILGELFLARCAHSWELSDRFVCAEDFRLGDFLRELGEPRFEYDSLFEDSGLGEYEWCRD